MLTVGLDTHHRTSSLCIVNADGKVVRERTLRGGVELTVAALAQLKDPFRVCYEASLGYGVLHDAVAALPQCRSVVVAHPGELRLIFKSRRKNDRIDARKLATLMLLDQVPAVHVPDLDVRAWRMLIESRRRTVDKRTRTKNGLRALLRGHAIRGPRSLWTKKGLEWLREVELPTSAARLRRELLLEELAHFDHQVQRITRELDNIARRHAGVRLLRTIPGVGPRTAETFVAYVDRPQRFRGIKTIGSYFGLVPSQDQSGGTNRLGRITRQGPATMRKFIIEAAWRAISKSDRLKAFYERIKGDDPKRNRIALVATAHHMLRVMLSMLRTGEAWREEVKAE